MIFKNVFFQGIRFALNFAAYALKRTLKEMVINKKHLKKCDFWVIFSDFRVSLFCVTLQHHKIIHGRQNQFRFFAMYSVKGLLVDWLIPNQFLLW